MRAEFRVFCPDNRYHVYDISCRIETLLQSIKDHKKKMCIFCKITTIKIEAHHNQDCRLFDLIHALTE